MESMSGTNSSRLTPPPPEGIYAKMPLEPEEVQKDIPDVPPKPQGVQADAPEVPSPKNGLGWRFWTHITIVTILMLPAIPIGFIIYFLTRNKNTTHADTNAATS